MNKDDRLLEEFLSGKSEIERIYREEATEKVPAELHDKIISDFRSATVSSKESMAQKPEENVVRHRLLDWVKELFSVPRFSPGIFVGGVTASFALAIALSTLLPTTAPFVAPPPAWRGVSGGEDANIDFLTIVPEIEQVIPGSAAPADADEEAPSQARGYYYVLQVASYTDEAEANQLSAELAKTGFSSSVQHISIQDEGDFYRVRVGPFSSIPELEKANRKLADKGFQALRLKVTQP